MELLPEEVRSLLPALYTNDGKDPNEVKVPLKIFDPSGRFTYYATEFDGEDTLFGFVCSPLGPDCDELGYMSLNEIQETRGAFGLSMERDIHWNPETTLKQVLDKVRR